jgi:hypothetical protein
LGAVLKRQGPRCRGAVSAVLKSLLASLVLLACAAPALASPWAEVGDGRLRSDIDILAAAGVVDNVTMQWPLPWGGLVRAIEEKDATEDSRPFVRAAAIRILHRADVGLRQGHLNTSVAMDATNRPNPVRGFDAMGREKFQGQISAEWNSNNTSIRVSAGAQLKDWNQKADLLLDGSYFAHKFGGALVYGGYLTHWWGPGWVSALSLSNNARPFPQIGIQRANTQAFSSPWLHWLGPWQAEFLVGVLDGPRVDKNTLYSGLRVNFSPLPGLEIGITRTEETCGTHHPCKPLQYYFEFRNDPKHVNHTNDQLDFDFRYTNVAWGHPYALYTQLMNEDSNPITRSGTSHLFGASVWFPAGDSTLRVTAEYTDSIATRNIFSFGEVMHGFAYNNYSYVDGMRYRGRSLGFSLDSDSRLATLQASLVTGTGWRYTLTYNNAKVSTPQNVWGNVATTAPVKINIGEFRVEMPFSWASLDLAARVQDDQLRPRHGWTAAFEAALVLRH